MRRILPLIILIWAAAICPAAIYTVPQDCAPGGATTCVTEEGNGATNNLFDNPSATRVQMAFVAADFVAAGCSGACVLSSLSFRLDNFQSALAPVNIGNVNISLSQVASARSNTNGLGLSAVYATNIDLATQLLVYSGGLTLASPVASGNPNAFDLVIPFQTNYTYAGGADLLVDISWVSGYTRINRALDATTLETGVNASASGYVVFGPSTGLNGSLSTMRVVAQFEGSPADVPEPGTSALALITVFGLLLIRRTRSQPSAGNRQGGLKCK